jgi:hypothetical protein
MIKYEVTIIPGKGRALKALKRILADEIILENHILTISDILLNDEILRSHVMHYYGKQNCIMLGEATLVNHDDSPNCEVLIVLDKKLPKVVLIATRPIRKGEELTINYGPDYDYKRLK